MVSLSHPRQDSPPIKTVSQNEQKSAVNENLQKSADSKIKEEEEYTFDHEASHLDKDVKNEIKTETTFGKVHGNRATNANAAEVKQESSDDRILETSQVCCMHKNCT